MSSSDFQTVLIQDDRIANLTDKIHYAVNKGAQQVIFGVRVHFSERE